MPPKRPKEFVNPISFRTTEQYKFAQQMRRNPMRTEQKMWKALRANQLGVKFRRQHLVGPYIVDFYCVELKFAVEIDGNVHAEEEIRKSDEAREKWLIAHGCKLIRFTSHDVYHHMEGALSQLYAAIQSLKGNDPPLSPIGQRGK